MNHPFSLNISDLEAINLSFEEQLGDDEANQVVGGLSIATTEATGEEGGGQIVCISAPCPGSESGETPPPSSEPPVYTTLALGEEGGHKPPRPVVTKAKAWIEAGGWPIYW